MFEGDDYIETEPGTPNFEWDNLGRLPLDIKLDGLLIQNGMIRGNQFLTQKLTEVLTRLDNQHEVIDGRVMSIILSRAKNESEGRADVDVTKLVIKRGKTGLLLVPEEKFHRGSRVSGYKPEDVHKTLTGDNGLFLVLDS